jgi:hypothetical protein
MVFFELFAFCATTIVASDTLVYSVARHFPFMEKIPQIAIIQQTTTQQALFISKRSLPFIHFA